MMDPSGEKSVAERVADVAVFAPLGLLVTVVEAMPEIAAKGRSRFGPRMATARAVGELAVRQGYRQLVGLLTTRSPLPTALFGRDAAPLTPVSSALGPGPALDAAARGARVLPHSSNGHYGGASGQGGDRSVGELAIPSYDTLSAPQVVQRLAGLSRDELEAVREYETAARGRRMVLERVEQLLA
jgi:hypothetical protein